MLHNITIKLSDGKPNNYLIVEKNNDLMMVETETRGGWLVV